MGRYYTASQTPTITASSAYTSGDALGGLLTFSGAAIGGRCKILSVTVIDKGDQGSALDLVLFRQSVTATADKSAINISDADAAKSIGCVSVATGDYVDVGGAKIATKQVGVLAFTAGVDANLYGQMVVRGTPTYASTSDLIVAVTVESDTL